MKNSVILVLVVSIFLITPVFGQEEEPKQEIELKQEIEPKQEIESEQEIEPKQEIESEQEQETEPKQEEEPKQIIIENRTSLFPSYKYDTGRRIIDLKAKYLEKMVLSINDEKATYHLKKSKELSTKSKAFAYSGGLLIAIPIAWQFGGGEFNQLLFLPGCGLAAAGIVFALKSDKEKLKSVDRYNQVVEEEWGIFFQYLPENKQLGLRLSHLF